MNTDTLLAQDPDTMAGKLKRLGGSMSDEWNNILANQTVNALWRHSSPEQWQKQMGATVAGLMAINPQDELEGMLAAQLVASHSAAMECFRRAMISEQTFEGRKENLNQANRLSRTYTTLLEALNRHRGKGGQKVTVKHVHVHDGGQAIVGNVAHPGGGSGQKTKDQPHAPEPRSIAHESGSAMPSTIEAEREPVPSTGGQG